MARPSRNALALLAYVLVMAGSGIAAKAWHEERTRQAVYTRVFRVSPPPAALPGTDVSISYESFRLGHYEVCEVGNLRLATLANQVYYGGSGSGSFTSPAPGDPASESRSTYGFSFANVQVNVVNCHVETGGGRYPVHGPKRLLIVDQQGTVLSEVPLE